MTDMQQWARTPAQLAIIRMEQVRDMLAETSRFEDVKKIADLAEAARVYARQCGLGLEVQNKAVEIRLFAERRMGEILAASRKNPGTRGQLAGRDSSGGARVEPPEGPFPPGAGFQGKAPTYRELNISGKAAARAQRFARIPAEVFDSALAAVKAEGKEFTFSRVRAALAAALRTSTVADVPPAGPGPGDVARWLGRAVELLRQASEAECLAADQRDMLRAALDLVLVIRDLARVQA